MRDERHTSAERLFHLRRVTMTEHVVGRDAAVVLGEVRPLGGRFSSAGDSRLGVDDDLGIGLVYFLAGPLGYGAGKVTAVTYEYGNAFLIVAGLLNLLVILDAYDVARGRK